ncbi:MAG: AAA family ATPase [Candidatus Limnocylindria bacterium]
MVLITGIMGAGKSSVAQALAERLPRAAHVRGDAFRRMIVTGRAEMVPGANDEALTQLRLRYALAASVADGYAAARFTAVYQDIILGEDLPRVVASIRARPRFVVVLAPRAETALRRAELREGPSGYGEWTAEALDDLLRDTPRIGLWLDTSDLTVPETVDAILLRAVEARVD